MVDIASGPKAFRAGFTRPSSGPTIETIPGCTEVGRFVEEAIELLHERSNRPGTLELLTP